MIDSRLSMASSILIRGHNWSGLTLCMQYSAWHDTRQEENRSRCLYHGELYLLDCDRDLELVASCKKKLLDTHYDCHDRWVVYVRWSLGRWLNPLGPRGISKMAESEKRSCSQVIMIDDNLKVPICQTYFSEQMIHKLIVKTRESRKGKNFAKVSITSLSNCLNTNEWVGIVNSRYINAWGSIKVTGCKTRSAERIWHMSPLALPQFRVNPVRKKYFKHCENITLLTHNIKSETPGASSHRSWVRLTPTSL